MIDELDKDQILSDISQLETGIQNLYNVTVYKLDVKIDELIGDVQDLYQIVEDLEVEE
ncbi:hypothetical protein [Anaerococcus sp. Marseille-Q5996]|uniref:hypothetical protein n=1 Tax=Anaerococcus sp. Marseille-Q5996 TaxID=2972769 RepID=UPI0021CA678B|nr:hypothetical protein [Anaerococcus sp. Marseille-Q5996]